MKTTMKQIIFIALMLISCISMSAQTAADAMYKEGITLKSQKTKASLSTAINKFKNAAGLYASLVNKNKCEVQIAVCKVYQKRLSQATARNTHKTYSKNTQASRSKQQSTLEKAVSAPSGTNKAVASEENFSEEFKIMRDAAIKGDANAQFYMACKYGMGEEVSKDEQEAFRWCLKAAEQGHAVAQYNVGYDYAEAVGVTQNLSEAAKWYRKAAEQGEPWAQFNLGDAYYIGKGVAQDYSEAFKWFKKAASQGDERGLYDAGMCYLRGHGVAQNFSEAYSFFMKSAARGYAPAVYNVGVCYYTGKGVAQDNDEALKWFKKAAGMGNADAISALKELGIL